MQKAQKSSESETPKKKKVEDPRGKSNVLYLFLRVFRVLFLLTLLLLLAIQPLVNSSFVGNKIKESLNKQFDNAFNWDSYHFSLLKRELTVNGFSMVYDGDTLVAFEKAVVQFRPFRLLSGTIHIPKGEIYRSTVNFAIDSTGKSGFDYLFPSDTTEVKKKPLSFLLKGIKIEDANIFYKDMRSNTSACVNNLNMGVYYSSQFQDCDVTLSTGAISYEDTERDFFFDTLYTFAEMIEGDLSEVEIFLESDSAKLSLGGELHSVFNIKEAEGDLTLDCVLPMGILQNIVGDTTIGSGVLKLKAVHEGSITNPLLDITASFRGNDFFYSPINSIDLDVNLDDSMKANVQKSTIVFKDGETFHPEGWITISPIFPNGFLHGYLHEGLHEMRWFASVDANHTPKKKVNYDFYDVHAEGSGKSVLPESMKSSLQVKGNSRVRVEDKVANLAVVSSVNFTKKVLTLKNAKLFDSGREVITVNGDINFFTDFLNLSGKIDSLDLATVVSPYTNIPLYGTINSTIAAKGKIFAPSTIVDLHGKDIMYDKYPLGSLNIDFSNKSPKGTIALSVEQSLDKNHVTLNCKGRVFKKGSFSLLKSPHIALKFNSDINLESFVSEGLKGKCRANGTYEGNLERGTGSISLTSDSIVTPFLSLEQIRFGALFDDKQVVITEGDLDLPHAGHISVTGTIGRDQKTDLSIDAKSVILDSIPYVADLKLSANSSLKATVTGLISSPVVSVTTALKDFSYDGYSLEHPLLCTLDYTKDSVIGDLHIGKSHVRATYNLVNGQYEAGGAIKEFALDDLFAYFKLDRLNGDISADFNVKGTNEVLTLATVSVDSITLYDKLKRVVSSNGIAFHYDSIGTSIDTLQLTFNDSSSLSVKGRVLTDGTLSLKANGEIPFDNLSSFVPEINDAKGQALINLEVDGSMEDPRPEGTVSLNGLGCTILSTDQEISDLKGSVRFLKNGNIKPVIEANFGEGGYVLLNGTLDMDSLSVDYGDIDISLYKIPIVVPDMADLVIGGELAYDIRGEKHRLGGVLELNEGYYYQNISLIPDLSKKRKGLVNADTTQSFLDLGVKILPKGNFVVDNNFAYLEIVPDLLIKGSEKKTALEGRAVVENGEISYLNTTFEVEEGQIDFVNPERIQMDVMIKAKATVRNYTMTLTLTGDPESKLDFKLEGVDSVGGAVEDKEVISLLITGYTREEFSEISGEDIFKIIQQYVNKQIAESDFKMIDRLSIDLGKEGSTFTLGEDLTRRLSTDLILVFSENSANQQAKFTFKIQDNVFINSFIDSKENSGGSIGFEFKKR